MNHIFKEINKLSNESFDKFGTKGKILDKPLIDWVDNFYMTDPISRASITMSECTSKLIKIKKNKVA